MSIVNYPTVGQVGSLAGAAHLSNDNTGVLRWAQWEQKSHVEQKGKSSLDFDFQNFQGYNVALKYDTIWISEPYLDSNVPLDDNILSLNGCNLNQVDYPDMSREEVSVCTTRKTLSWELLTLLNSASVYYVIRLVRIRKVILLLFIAHQVRHIMNLWRFSI